MRLVNQPYWRLRDYLRSEGQRQRREQAYSQAALEVSAAAAEDATYGYRHVHQRLRERGSEIGRERVRHLMGELGLQPSPAGKKKRPKHPVAAEADWPEGRRMQIDATNFRGPGRLGVFS